MCNRYRGGIVPPAGDITNKKSRILPRRQLDWPIAVNRAVDAGVIKDCARSVEIASHSAAAAKGSATRAASIIFRSSVGLNAIEGPATTTRHPNPCRNDQVALIHQANLTVWRTDYDQQATVVAESVAGRGPRRSASRSLIPEKARLVKDCEKQRSAPQSPEIRCQRLDYDPIAQADFVRGPLGDLVAQDGDASKYLVYIPGQFQPGSCRDSRIAMTPTSPGASTAA